MPKAIARSKTRKAVAKRFKVTGTGKVLRQHASRRHLLSSKSGKRKRHMAKSAVVDKTDVRGSRRTFRSPNESNKNVSRACKGLTDSAVSEAKTVT